ncbi:cationic peroxidase 2-like [Panicum miliaceum]|uniref:Cationic peroxidase 2-like n=1 Tax=Panicum miliaceum TaxID=4540 RepID=A0A3L6QNJ8_PANMI|nr:cationic peroxidase 2-like [Panicum miliaceum]
MPFVRDASLVSAATSLEHDGDPSQRRSRLRSRGPGEGKELKPQPAPIAGTAPQEAPSRLACSTLTERVRQTGEDPSQGCDASVLLDGRWTEKAAGPDLSLGGLELVDAAKAACPAGHRTPSPGAASASPTSPTSRSPARTRFVSPRLCAFRGNGGVGPFIDPGYAQEMMRQCPTMASTNRVVMTPGTGGEFTFDTSY